MDSREFDPKLFTRPSEYEEDALRDRKSEIKILSAKAELIKDVISMANTACLWGRPAYILYGIRDSATGDPDYDVQGLQVNDEQKMWEQYRQDFAHVFNQHIRPKINHWSFLHGRVNGKVVAYLCFQPHNPPEPYQVAESRKRRVDSLQEGQSWIRAGESKREITPDERDSLTFQVPWVLPRQWEMVFDRQLARLSQLFQQTQGYQQLGLTTKETLDDRLRDFLEDRDCAVLVIQGAPGIGKTVALGRFAYQLADDALAAVKRIRMDHQFDPPSSPIPIYYKLLQYEGWPAQQFVEQLLKDFATLDSAPWKQQLRVEFLLRRQDLKWVICLDGFDEIRSELHRKKFINCLTDFVKRYPRAKVIVTTRPPLADQFDHPFQGMVQIQKVDIESLSEEQVLAYLKSVASSELVDQSFEFLKSDPDLWRLCRVPVYLEQAVTELVGAKPARSEYSDVSDSLSQAQQSEPPVQQTDLSESRTDAGQDIEQLLESVKLTDGLSLPGNGLSETSTVSIAETTGVRDQIEGRFEQLLPWRTPRLGVVVRDMYEHLWKRESSRQPHNSAKLHQWREQVNKFALSAPVFPNLFSLQDVPKLLNSQAAIGWISSLGIWEEVHQHGYRYMTLLTQASFAASFLEGRIRAKRAQQVNLRDTALRERIRQLLKDCVDDDISSLFDA